MLQYNQLQTDLEVLEKYLTRFLDMGFLVIPIKPNEKLPRFKWKDLSIDECKKNLKHWIYMYCDGNWAIVLPRGICILDVDAKGTVNGFDTLGQDNIKLLEQLGVPMQETPNGGRHYFFKADWETKLGILSGIDLKNYNGYVIIPPSVVEGKSYRWIREIESIDKIPEPPDWLEMMLFVNNEEKKKIEEKERKWEKMSVGEIMIEVIKEIVTEGNRNNWLFSVAKKLRWAGADSKRLYTLLTTLNEKCCIPPLPDSKVKDIVGYCCSKKPTREEWIEEKREENKSRRKDKEETLANIIRKKTRLFCIDDTPYLAHKGGVITIDSRSGMSYILRMGEKCGIKLKRNNLYEIQNYLMCWAMQKELDGFSVRCNTNHKRTVLDLDGRKRKERVIWIDEHGWRNASKEEIRECIFIDRKGLPLPNPEGNINDLNCLSKLFNVDEMGFGLLVAWLAHTLLPPPYQILLLTGPPASGKSTAASYLKRIIDNRKPIKSTLPPNERDLYAQFYNTFVLCLDNISSIPQEHSDTICAFSTGSGSSNRKLYTNYESVSIEGARPIILNGISIPKTRTDLIDRCVWLDLLPRKVDIDEPILERIFNENHSKFLGALLDLTGECWKSMITEEDISCITMKYRSVGFRRAVLAVDKFMFGGK